MQFMTMTKTQHLTTNALVEDIRSLMEHGDELRYALMLELDDRALLVRSLAATIYNRRRIVLRIQRMLEQQYARASAHLTLPYVFDLARAWPGPVPRANFGSSTEVA